MYRFRIDGPDIPFCIGLAILLIAAPVHTGWPMPLPSDPGAFHSASFNRDLATAFVLFIGFLYLCFASTYRVIHIFRDGVPDLNHPGLFGKSIVQVFAPLIVVIAVLLFFRHVL